MSEYLPLARKYRPQNFSDVIGQDIAVKILSQAIRKNRLGPALLFTGTRGVGKTTLARIIARTLRCENIEAAPCGNCRACKEFDTNSVDVLEMDAASHTSVDDIRDIIDSCKYCPTSGKYKIYIIDEVHMLSKSAFNALLKTLEEPPAHIKFIFATTELYKIPDTIVSRCMRFDLKKIDTNLIVQFLASICNKEKVAFEEGGLAYIARAAKGSIRDSLSILDQAISLSDGKLIENQIREMLCGISYSSAINIMQVIFSGNAKAAILEIRSIIRSGTNAKLIIRTLLEIVHRITCLKIGTNYIGNCSLSHTEEIELSKSFSNTDLSKLTSIWQILSHENEISYDDELAPIALELLIIRLCYASTIPDLEKIIGNLQSEASTKSISNSITSKTASTSNQSLTDTVLSRFPGSAIVE